LYTSQSCALLNEQDCLGGAENDVRWDVLIKAKPLTRADVAMAQQAASRSTGWLGPLKFSVNNSIITLQPSPKGDERTVPSLQMDLAAGGAIKVCQLPPQPSDNTVIGVIGFVRLEHGNVAVLATKAKRVSSRRPVLQAGMQLSVPCNSTAERTAEHPLHTLPHPTHPVSIQVCTVPCLDGNGLVHRIEDVQLVAFEGIKNSQRDTRSVHLLR
jgi:hypothetical protein